MEIPFSKKPDSGAGYATKATRQAMLARMAGMQDAKQNSPVFQNRH
jgi:hypothetical protein